MNIIMKLDSFETIKQYFKNGLGITVLPGIVVTNETQTGKLMIVHSLQPS
jgi:DNA-binding transcriptional LysR family regulator